MTRLKITKEMETLIEDIEYWEIQNTRAKEMQELSQNNLNRLKTELEEKSKAAGNNPQNYETQERS